MPAVSFALCDEDERIVEIYSTALNRQIGFILATPQGFRVSLDDDIEPVDLGGGLTIRYDGAPQSIQFDVADRVERTRQASLNLMPGGQT